MQSEEFVSHRTRRNFNRAEKALASGNYTELKGLAERCLADVPQVVDGWIFYAEACGNLGLHREGTEMIARGMDLHPQNYRLKILNIKFLMGLGKRRECLLAIRELLAQGEPEVWSIGVLGRILTMLDEVALALPLYQLACQNGPDSAENWLNLANAERATGDLDQAKSHLRKALELNPELSRAYWELSSLRKATDEDNSIDKIRKLLDGGELPSIDRAQLGYAMGKDFEDLERWDAAFDSVEAAGKARRESVAYDHRHTADLVDNLVRIYTKDFIDDGQRGYDSSEPVFIIGMPRSGTTLIERILGVHPDVFAAGELAQFTLALEAALGSSADPVLNSEQIQQTQTIDFYKLGQDYIESTRPRTGHTTFFTDKLPINFLYLGLIAKALPNAKFVHLTRNPMDTCWSNFKQIFGDLYAYSYNLEDTAGYFVLYHQLMRHWQRVMSERIFEISYEGLVENQEYETRRLLDYCGLSWQDDCLNFHKNKDAVTTASSVQVRQPIYKSSMQRWKNLQHRMQSVKHIFDEAGINY